MSDHKGFKAFSAMFKRSDMFNGTISRREYAWNVVWVVLFIILGFSVWFSVLLRLGDGLEALAVLPLVLVWFILSLVLLLFLSFALMRRYRDIGFAPEWVALLYIVFIGSGAFLDGETLWHVFPSIITLVIFIALGFLPRDMVKKDKS